MTSQNHTTWIAAVFMVILSTTAPAAQAKTWRVEKDGTGDYTVIQDAVDIAASGDTIQIGIGRFNDQQLVTCPGWSEFVRVLVHQHELTIIGSGTETIIGQEEPWELEQGSDKGIVSSDGWGSYIIRIQNLQMENMRTGIYTSHEGAGDNSVEIRDCAFYANLGGISLIGDGGEAQILNCNFYLMARNGVHLATWNQSLLDVRDCIFTLMDVHQWSQAHLKMWGVQSGHIQNCKFFEGSTGLGSIYGGPILVEDCLFDGQSNIALSLSVLSNVTIDDCAFKNQNSIFSSNTPDNQIFFKNSTIENVSDYAFYISFIGSIRVTNCDLSGGERGIVWCADRNSCPEIETLDFSGNYWGTTEPDSIQAWIRDRHDSDEACFYINYEPFLTDSTPIETKSLGGFKAMFR